MPITDTSLDLSFMAPGVMPNGVTFTRASTATYFDATGTLQTAATNAPRWDYDPVTHALKGLLVEEARTNQVLNSADASNASWLKTSGTVVAPVVTGNQVIAPDGTTTAAQVVYPAVTLSSNFSNLRLTAITATVAAYAASIWARGSVGGETVWLCCSPDGVLYYSTPITLTTTWQRFSLITPNLTATAWGFNIGIDRRDGVQQASSPQTIYVWGGQLELGAFPTSYIPTTAASVTRAIDSATMPAGAWFSPSVTSLVAECMMEWAPNTSASALVPVSISDGSAANIIRCFGLLNNSSTAAIGVIISSAVTNGASLGSPAANVSMKVGGVWNGTTMIGSLNGQAVVSQNVGMPSGLNVMTFGASFAGSIGRLDGWLRRVRYWPRALSASELQQATGSSIIPDPASLDLNFMVPGTLDPSIAFTRASIGTYFDATGTLQTAANNAPRWDYNPNTHALRGVLIEEARTNLVVNSATGMTPWTTSAITMTAASGVAPDGTNTMTRIAETAVSAGHYAYGLYAITASTMYNLSFFTKAGEDRYIQVFGDNGSNSGAYVNFDLQAGTVCQALAGNGGTAATLGTASIQAIGNGIYRLSMSVTLGTAGTSLRYGFCLLAGPNGSFASTYPGNALNGLYVWGFQLEAGAFPTSYIPTTGATVARAVDIANMTPLGAWFNASTGSLVTEFDSFAGTGTGHVPGGFSSGAFANTLYHALSAANAIVGGTGYGSVGATVAYTGAVQKMGLSYTAGALTACNNGSPAGTPAVLPAGPYLWTSNLAFGVSPWSVGGNALDGHIRRVRYWPRALSNAELRLVTAPGVQAQARVLVMA